MIKFALILALCTSAFAQLNGSGKCPDFNTLKDYKVEKDLGTWHVYKRNFDDQEEGGKCNKNVYSLIKDRTLRIVSTQVNSESGIITTTEARATFINKRREALFNLSFPNLIPSTGKYYYLLLSNDYENTAVNIICEEKAKSHSIYAFIETRERSPTRSVIRKALDVLEQNGIDRNSLKRTNLSGCEA